MLRLAFDGRSLAEPVLRGWDRYAVGLVGELVRRGVEVTLFHRARRPLNPLHLEGLGCRVRGLRDLSGMHYEQVVVPSALASAAITSSTPRLSTACPWWPPAPW